MMDDDLMFSMEEEEGMAKRPPVHRRGASQRTCSLSGSNASEDDDDEDHFILPILVDSAKEICHHLKDLVNTRQLSNSLPKSSFSYRVSLCSTGTFHMLFMFTCTCKDGQLPLDFSS